MKASLLCSDHDDEIPIPLSDGTFEDDAVSEFSRLLSVVRNPNDTLGTPDTGNSVLVNPNARVILNYQRRKSTVRCIGDSESDSNRNDTLQTMARAPPPCSPSFTIVVSGACALLFVGFMWASFTSSSWSETLLLVLIELPTLTSTSATIPLPLPQLTVLPVLPISEQATIGILPIASTTLSSIIQLLLQADQVGISTLLWLTSLVIPCLFMVLTPSWIVQVYSTNKNNTNSCARPDPTGTFYSTTGTGTDTGTGTPIAEGESWLRHGFHLLFRWVFTVVFVMLLITSSCQHIKMQWSHSLVLVHNKIENGLATFSVGILFAIIAISVLRLGSAEYQQLSFRHRRHDVVPQDSPLLRVAEPERSVATDSRVKSDRQAGLARDSIREASDDGTQMMRILEDGPLMEMESTARDVLHTDDTSLPSAVEGHSSGVWEATPTTFCQIFTVFQVGLLAILLWIPSIMLPIIRFEYSGFATEFFSGNVGKTLTLYEVPLVLYNDGIMAKSPPWIFWLIGTLTFGCTVVCPLLAIGLCISIWMVSPDACPPTGRWSRRTLRAWLFAIHPAVGTIVLAFAVFIASHGVEAWSSYIFNSTASRHFICDHLERLTGESCLAIRGRPMGGAWFYLLHAVLLEGFILLTRRWS